MATRVPKASSKSATEGASAPTKRRAKKGTSPAASDGADPAANAALHPKAHDELARASVELLRREPFFGHLVAAFPRHLTEQVPTMAVALRDGQVQLLINPRFLLEQLKALGERTAVLKHEVLHVVFKHLFRLWPEGDPRLWNIAADLVVNQFVAPFPLPDGALSLDMFSDLRLEPNDTAESYYQALAALHESVSRANSQLHVDGAGDAGPSGSGPGDQSKSPATSRSAETLRRLLEKGLPSDHGSWASSPAREIDGAEAGGAVDATVSEAIWRNVEDQLVRAHQRTKASRGTVPQWVDRLIGEVLQRRVPVMDWRRMLRVFAQSSRRTRIVATQRRESKRFENIEGARRHAGIKVKRFQRLAVAIDTSGSVDEARLHGFFNEIRAIHRQGAEVVVVECDAAVARAYEFDGKTPSCVTGGGGTSFDPVIAWLREQRPRFDACVYLTDGRAPAPTAKAPCALLWVVTPDGTMEHLPGRKVMMAPVAR